MIETLLEATSLPNLHPAVVHFPLVLLPLAVGLELWALTRWGRSLERAAVLVWALGGLAAWAAVWAGERAADSLFAVPATVQPAIAEHSDWAHWAFWFFGALASLRLLIWWRDRHSGPAPSRVRAGLAILGLGGLLLLGRAADLGGSLVYEHGVSVAPREHVEEAVPAAQGPGAQLGESLDGHRDPARPTLGDGASCRESQPC